MVYSYVQKLIKYKTVSYVHYTIIQLKYQLFYVNKRSYQKSMDTQTWWEYILINAMVLPSVVFKQYEYYHTQSPGIQNKPFIFFEVFHRMLLIYFTYFIFELFDTRHMPLLLFFLVLRNFTSFCYFLLSFVLKFQFIFITFLPFTFILRHKHRIIKAKFTVKLNMCTIILFLCFIFFCFEL